MKKNVKGFTLIELIIVMAILAILMAAIMQMFKPIRSTYVDATLYENQRTAQNGMIQYITESTRYATDLGLYSKSKLTTQTVSGAVDAFAAEYIAKNNITNITGGAQNATNAKEAIQRYAEVIIIDGETGYTFNNGSWKGRILRRKFYVPTGSTKPDKISNNAEDYTKTDECRVALGASYYGDRNYTITFLCGDSSKLDSSNKLKTGETWAAKDGIKITVGSYTKQRMSSVSDAKTVVTAGEVMCKNLASASDHGVSKAGIFDTSKYDTANPSVSNTKVYIVYLNPGKDGSEAVRAAAGLIN